MADKHHGSLSPECALLGFLCERSSHGYDLHQNLSNEFGFVWHISLSQTYNILKRLEKQGDISFKLVEQEKLPARQLYSITPQGRKRFMDWLAAPTGHSIRAIRLELLTRLYFARRFTPQQIPSMLDQQAREISTALARLELNQADLPSNQTFNWLSLRLRIQQLQSALEWLNECRKALT